MPIRHMTEPLIPENHEQQEASPPPATTAVLLALSGVAAGGAQAVPFEPGLPLSPLGQLTLSPASQQNAVRSAQDYIDMSGFSRQGLIKQLEYEDFSTEDAIFAVDHITVDWNVQAARSAKDYLDMSGFSHSKLVAQLEYEGFTQRRRSMEQPPLGSSQSQGYIQVPCRATGFTIRRCFQHPARSRLWVLTRW